jgi:hypothetical protein
VKNVVLTTGGAIPNQAIAARFTVSPPFADNILAMQDANAHQDLAKKGEYTIQRHANDTIVWNEAEDVRPIWRVASALTTGTTQAVMPNNGFQKVDGFDMNMGWIVQNIRGISQQASIHLKTRSCIVATVPGTSPWAPIMKPIITKDQPALVLYKELSAKLPHSFVSDYNDWGLLSKTILSCITRIAAPLARSGLRAGYASLNNVLNQYAGPADPMPFNASRGGYGNRGFSYN